MNNKQNAERAKKVVNSWPEWKQKVQLTKYRTKYSEQQGQINKPVTA